MPFRVSSLLRKVGFIDKVMSSGWFAPVRKRAKKLFVESRSSAKDHINQRAFENAFELLADEYEQWSKRNPSIAENWSSKR